MKKSFFSAWQHTFVYNWISKCFPPLVIMALSHLAQSFVGEPYDGHSSHKGMDGLKASMATLDRHRFFTLFSKLPRHQNNTLIPKIDR